MADEKQNEQQEDELRDLDVPDERAEDVKGGNAAVSGTNMSLWTTTHGGGGGR